MENYNGLLFTPLAMEQPPIIDTFDFVDWMARHQIPEFMVPKYAYETIRGEPYPWEMCAFKGDFSALTRDHPNLWHFFNQYPLKRINSLVFLAQRAEVPTHLHVDTDGAFGFRCYLSTGYPEGLYFRKTKDPSKPLPIPRYDESGNPVVPDWNELVDMSAKHYAKHAPGVRTFMLNSHMAAHAVDPSTCKVGERIAVLVVGELDKDKLKTLLDRSTDLYKPHQVWL